jgi:hypothetical protein
MNLPYGKTKNEIQKSGKTKKTSSQKKQKKSLTNKTIIIIPHKVDFCQILPSTNPKSNKSKNCSLLLFQKRFLTEVFSIQNS